MKRLLIMSLALLALACDIGPIKRVKEIKRDERYWGTGTDSWHTYPNLLIAEDGSKCDPRNNSDLSGLVGQLVQCEWVTPEAVVQK